MNDDVDDFYEILRLKEVQNELRSNEVKREIKPRDTIRPSPCEQFDSSKSAVDMYCAKSETNIKNGCHTNCSIRTVEYSHAMLTRTECRSHTLCLYHELRHRSNMAGLSVDCVVEANSIGLY